MNEWTDVKDELPAYGRRVLIKDVSVVIGFRKHTDKDGEFWSMDAFGTSRDVRYWMPLPT